MSGPEQARPRRVTIGGGLALTGCVLLVVTLLDSMGQVRSTQMRHSLEQSLSTPPASTLGLDVEVMLGILRGIVFASGALAATGVVLAVFVLRRHRGARVGLTVVALLMLFSTTFVTGLLPLLIVVAVSMLWGRESGVWFAGSAPRPVAAAFAPPTPWSAPPWSAPPAGPPVGPQPGPAAGPAPGPAPAVQAPGTSPPVPLLGPPRTPPGDASAPGGRPRGVVVAAWTTWVFSVLTALFFLLLVVVIVANQAALLDQLQRDPQISAAGYSRQALLAALWIASAIGIGWSLAASALAVLAYQRVNLGRIGLVVSALLTFLLGVISVAGLLNAVAAVAVVVMLFRGGANQWYAGARPPRPSGEDPTERPPRPGDADKPPVW